MFILKDQKCIHCGGEIEVLGCYEDDKKSSKTLHLVSNGVCTQCLKGMVLPTEEFEYFVKAHCIRID